MSPKLEAFQQETGTIPAKTTADSDETRTSVSASEYDHDMSALQKSGSDFSEISEAEFSDHSSHSNISTNQIEQQFESTSPVLGTASGKETSSEKLMSAADIKECNVVEDDGTKIDVQVAQNESLGLTAQKEDSVSDNMYSVSLVSAGENLESEIVDKPLEVSETSQSGLSEGWAVDSLVLDDQSEDVINNKETEELIEPDDKITEDDPEKPETVTDQIVKDDFSSIEINKLECDKHSDNITEKSTDNLAGEPKDDEGVERIETEPEKQDMDTILDTEEPLQVHGKLVVDDTSLENIERNTSTSTLSMLSEDLSDSNRTIMAESSDSDKANKSQDSLVLASIDSDSSLQETQSIVDEEGKAGSVSAQVQNSDNMESFIQAGREFIESTLSNVSDSSSSSLVKNMLEEAMVESAKDNDSHSSVSTERSSSDLVRIESGVNSGQTSGDEVDTTTSSDIEIISTPTPNGENSQHPFKPVDLSPLRHAFKGLRRSPPGHKRSDSGSSSQSRNGDDLTQETRPGSRTLSDETAEKHGGMLLVLG